MSEAFKIENLARINKYINFDDNYKYPPKRRNNSIPVPDYQTKSEKFWTTHFDDLKEHIKK